MMCRCGTQRCAERILAALIAVKICVISMPARSR
jgi:hypothetical protein